MIFSVDAYVSGNKIKAAIGRAVTEQASGVVKEYFDSLTVEERRKIFSDAIVSYLEHYPVRDVDHFLRNFAKLSEERK